MSCDGRNYDFENDTSAMLVHCRPAKGYESVATAALDNIGMNAPEDEKRARWQISQHLSYVWTDSTKREFP